MPKHPDPKKHQQISFAKSALRITGYLALLVNPLVAVAFLVISEALGILEELVWAKNYSIIVPHGVNHVKH